MNITNNCKSSNHFDQGFVHAPDDHPVSGENDRCLLTASKIATILEELFGLAPTHANLLATHVVNANGGPLESKEALENALSIIIWSGPVTAHGVEQIFLLLEQLLTTGPGIDLLDAYREVLAAVPPETELQDYTPEEIEAYNELHKAFMHEHGEEILHHHHQWHRENGSGGTRGPGSGEPFVTMHRHMMTTFENFVNNDMQNSDWTIPELDPSRPLPPNMGQPSDVSPELDDRTSDHPNTTRPDHLMPDGNNETPFILDGKAHYGLEDFETLDDLGRALVV